MTTMNKLLSLAQAALSMVLVWALWYDLAHGKNEWWSTSLLALFLLVTASSAIALFRAKR